MAAKQTKVTLLPSEQVVAQAVAEVTVPDARGRTLRLRKPGVLAQFRLIEALGDTAKNEVYVRMVMPLLYLGAIDDDALILMTTKPQIEALIQRLGEEGIAAVIEGVQEHFGARDPQADKAQLGNS